MIDIDSILEKNDIIKDEFIYLYDVKQAIKEIVEKTLELAAENAKTIQDEDSFYNSVTIVDKQSIINQIENIKF